MRAAVVLVSLALVSSSPARAQAADERAVSDGRAAFDVPRAGEAGAATPGEVAEFARWQRHSRQERRLRTTEEVLGFATLALLAAANVLGSLDYYDKYAARGTDTGQFSPWHEGVSLGATATFAGGILELVRTRHERMTPKLDRAFIHKLALIMTAVGFVAELVLGPVSAASDGKLYQRGLAVSHVVIGWATFGFEGTSMLTYRF